MKFHKLFTTLFIFILYCPDGYGGACPVQPVEEPHCMHHTHKDKSLRDIHQAIQIHNQIADLNTDSSVANAPCRAKKPPSLKQMQRWLHKWAERPDSQKEIMSYGKSSLDENTNKVPVSLQRDPPKLRRLFQLLSEKAELNPESKCHNVICASQELFGEKQGVQLLYMLARYGFNGSPYRFPNAELWDAKGLDKVLSGLSDFPEDMLPFVYNKPLVRFKRGYIRENNQAIEKDNDTTSDWCNMANSFIEFFDCIEKMSTEKFISTVVHEVAHVISYESNLHKSPLWFQISGWTEQKVQDEDDTVRVSYEFSKPKCMVSEYGSTSPTEDFAESVVSYRYNARKLKKNCPRKYYYIKDLVFNGVEYLNQKSCN